MTDLLIKVIIPDSGPLISLGRGNVLEVLLLLGLPVYVTDQVKHEATKDKRFPDAVAIERFMDENEDMVLEFPTKIGREAAEAREGGYTGRQPGLGEESVAECLARLNEIVDTATETALLIFEDADVIHETFPVPDNVHVVSTRSYLEGLEDRKLIASADEVWKQIANGGRNPSPKLLERPGTVAGLKSGW